ncbi:MAG TPA: CHASE2 domain-containing protein [Bryobacteraceae bacterium]|nr:CHASE2 domain-containing protein [Bryobacteraceae bacterium]
MPSPSKHRFAYAGVLAGAFLVALVASWTPLGTQIDNTAYDWIFRLKQPPPWQPESIVLAIDELSFTALGGQFRLRRALAEGLERIAAASPKAVALDVTLADEGEADSDQRLESAFRTTHNLILPCDLLPDGSGWDDPLPRFHRWAAAVGHVHADVDTERVARSVTLEKVSGHDRRWALALEAYRVSRSADILETPHTLELGEVSIPASNATGRTMRIRYWPPKGEIPWVTLKQLLDNPALASQFAGKVVFAGVTAQTAVKDRWFTPYSSPAPIPGVEFHANAFETIAQQRFLTSAPEWSVVLFCLLLTTTAGTTFAWFWGWRAIAIATCTLVVAHATPYFAFGRGTVFPFSPGVSAAWLSVVSAGLWQWVYVRRRLVKSEAERDRYQHAMQFVTHEMRTPLTAIQGSSELMSRYAMPEEKRKEISQLIHSESKRLGRMIQIFLDVERLSAGEMELKKENFPVREVMTTCIDRARPLADRKQIRITVAYLCEEVLCGDRELMEYAIYNLLTNAIKYSPSNTEVTVSGSREGDHCAVSVRDQGIGMDQKEVRKIFQKFYRTKRAEQSGEAGTGIGLSIVEQIVLQHGGRIDVESAPGEGSCFTLRLPVAQAVAAKPLVTN